VCDATLAFIKRCNVISAIIKTADFREQGACIKFCFKLGKTATEFYEMLKTAFGEQAMGRSQTFQWFSRFNPLNPELNPMCYLLALLGAHHFLHVIRIRVKSLNFRLLMSYIYIYMWSTHS